MPNIRFEPSGDGDKISLNIYGLDQATVDEKDLLNEFQRTEFRRYHLDPASLQKACKILKKLQQEQRQAGATADEAAALAVSLVVAERREAHVELDVSADRMQCYLLIETAFGASNPSADDIACFLNEHGISHGIKSNILQALASRLDNLAPGARLSELVAEGDAPGKTVQAQLVYVIEPVQDRLMKPQLRDDGTVDMYDFGEIKLVQPGDILMERTPPVVGSPGKNVLGETLYAAQPEERALLPGEGTELNTSNRNQLVATRKGVPLRIDAGMMVADTYCVADVDLSTGNITFDGSVLVQGSVREGMTVKATGDVIIRDYVESAHVDAGGKVIIGKGVLGRKADSKELAGSHGQNMARIHAGQDCHANYAQYADIEAGGKVTVAKHLMHCSVTAEAIEVLSAKRTEGKVLGGTLYPLKSLACNVLGAPSYIQTTIDFSKRLSGELGELLSINEELGERVNVVRGMRAALRQFEVKSGSADIEEQVNKINNTISHFESLMQVLKQRRNHLVETILGIRETFVIDIHKTLYPGVSVRFVDKEIPIKEEKSMCQIKAKDQGLTYFTLR